MPKKNVTSREDKLEIVASQADSILVQLIPRHKKENVQKVEDRISEILTTEFRDMPTGAITLAIAHIRDSLIFSMID